MNDGERMSVPHQAFSFQVIVNGSFLLDYY